MLPTPVSSSSPSHRSPTVSGPGLVAGLLALLVVFAVPLAAQEAAAVDRSGYRDFAQVERDLRTWAERSEVELIDIGTSAGGRTLHVLRIAAAGDVAPEERPAVFVGANIAGFHNAGTEAAFDLVETLLASENAERIARHTYYVAPALNPDAHDQMFAPLTFRRGANDGALDRDRDGLEAEDGFDDLDGDGRITRLRIPDPAGGWLPHPDDGRLMVRADPAKGRRGTHRMASEGRDDDGDGERNEDPRLGVVVDRNFAHQFPHPEPEAGPWPSYAPEAKAIMDFLLERDHVAAAVVYGPANNLLEKPQSLGGGGDLGTQRFTLPQGAAQFLGLDPEQEYTIDEVWAVAKDLPMVRQNNITKEQLGQFLGAGPATDVADEDRALLDDLAEAYEERLEEAGLSTDRPAEQYGKGGFTPWLYYQRGVFALELDVWGVPTPEKEEAEEAEAEGADAPLTLDRLETMDADEVIALGEEAIQQFLDDNDVPSQFNAQMVIGALQSGRIDPEQMASMMRQQGAGGGGGDDGDEDDPRTQRARDVLAWVEENLSGAHTPWTEVTLEDGTRAEVGGLDPFAEIAPPREMLDAALDVHTATVLDLADRLARLEMVALEVEPRGGGVHRVRAVITNVGEMATHTAMARRAQSHLPVRLEIETGDGVELVTGRDQATNDRLEPAATFEATWLVRAEDGATVTVRAVSDHAGAASARRTVGEEN